MNDKDVQLIRPLDLEKLQKIAIRLAKPDMVKWLWEDSLRANPLASFALVFMNPRNIVFDIGDGDGVASFANISPNWRASVYVAMWGPRATRKRDVWHKAIAIAMEMHNLLVVEAITRADNVAARRGLKFCGFKFRGSIPDRLCYNGVLTAGHWWEIDRAAVGLPERTT